MAAELAAIGAGAGALPLRTPEGKMPMVHWAILESVPGKMDEMMAIGARTVALATAAEAGTYALYGGRDKNSPDVFRLLEIYENEEAYRVHRASAGFKRYQTDRASILARLEILETDPIALEQKTSGQGRLVRMQFLEIRPEGLNKYKTLLAAEMRRAVGAEEGVMGLFATAEKDRPNRIRTFEIYADKEAYEKYARSESYKAYQDKTTAFKIYQSSIENQPTLIQLTKKGLRGEQQE